MSMSNLCKNCKHWKSEQMIFNFDKGHGYCTSPKLEYTMNSNEDQPRVLDRTNLNEKWLRTHFFQEKKVSGETNIPIGRYSLVTGQNFGCVNFEAKESNDSIK